MGEFNIGQGDVTAIEQRTGAGCQATDDQRKELDALRPTAAEHQALQARWAQGAQTLETLRAEPASARTDLAKEWERREQAEALRASVRRGTLKLLLAQFRPDHANATPADAVSGSATPAPQHRALARHPRTHAPHRPRRGQRRARGVPRPLPRCLA